MTRLNLLSVGSPTALRARASSRQPGLSRLLQTVRLVISLRVSTARLVISLRVSTARLVISLRVSSKRDSFSFFARSVRFSLGEKLNSKFKFNYLFLLETLESMPRPDDLGWEQVDPEGVQRSPVLRPLQTDSSLAAEPEDETVPVCPDLFVLTAGVTQTSEPQIQDRNTHWQGPQATPAHSREGSAKSCCAGPLW